MAARNALLVYEQDVYALSEKGEKELKASETSLSPAQIELLVRVDGKLTVAGIAASVRLLEPGAVIDEFRKLVDLQLVRLRSRHKSEGLGITGICSAKAMQPTREAIARARAEATDGTAALKKDGYYVRIARRDASKPAAPKNRAMSVIVVEDEPLLARFLKRAWRRASQPTATRSSPPSAPLRRPTSCFSMSCCRTPTVSTSCSRCASTRY
jgi:hypothetical protein